MMKKLISLFLAAAILCGAAAAAAETALEYKNIRIQVNGEKIILLDNEDEQIKSLTDGEQIYVPIEAFIKAIGGEYAYSADDNMITITIWESAGKKDEEPASPVGTWSYQIKGSTVTLAVRDDGSASLKVGKNTYKCEWKLDGTVFTLTQKGIPITGSYDGTYIILTVSNILMTFTR